MSYTKKQNAKEKCTDNFCEGFTKYRKIEIMYKAVELMFKRKQRKS